MARNDGCDAAEYQRHHHDEGARLTALGEGERRAVLKPFLLYPMVGLVLCKREDSIGETRVDLLVFAEFFRRRIRGLPEADALMNDLASNVI
jgi:hypothetical protein